MKKIALAAFSATALLALSACGDAAEEAPAEEAVVEEVAPIEPIAEDTAAVDAAAEEATDAAAEATDEAAAAADAAGCGVHSHLANRPDFGAGYATAPYEIQHGRHRHRTLYSG